MGLGIPMHDQKFIFNEFYRASNVTNIEKDSSGFGLSLVKQIIEKHNGTISVESKLNKGTTFKITLPNSQYQVTSIMAMEWLSGNLMKLSDQLPPVGSTRTRESPPPEGPLERYRRDIK